MATHSTLANYLSASLLFYFPGLVANRGSVGQDGDDR